MLSVVAPDAPGGIRKVWVYRPGVAGSAALPVVYFLHGLPGTYEDLPNLGVVAELNRLIGTGQLPPFVLATPDGNSTNASDPEWADSRDGRVRVETFVIGPLIAAVEGTQHRDRMHRMIAGFSMGGYGAMNIALQHPELYSAVASIAGYFDTDDESGIFEDDPSLLAVNSPDHHAGTALRLRVMLADGRDDSEPVVQGQTQRFAALLRAAGATPYVDIQPGSHTLSYLQAELPRALSFLLAKRP